MCISPDEGPLSPSSLLQLPQYRDPKQWSFSLLHIHGYLGVIERHTFNQGLPTSLSDFEDVLVHVVVQPVACPSIIVSDIQIHDDYVSQLCQLRT